MLQVYQSLIGIKQEMTKLETLGSNTDIGTIIRCLVCFKCMILVLLCALSVDQFCKDPGFPEHGIRTPNTGVFFENSVARFSCVDGYSLKGPAKIVCTRFHNGSLGWKPSLKPVCLSEGEDSSVLEFYENVAAFIYLAYLSFKDCLPPFIEDADVTNKTYRPGDSLIISCHEGFQIRYPDTETMESVCQADGTWDNQPTCQG